MWGDFNIANAAAAIKTAEIYGIKPELAIKILENIESLPGRMELIEERHHKSTSENIVENSLFSRSQNFKVIVDYAHTPDSMEAVYGSLKPKLTGNSKLICVFGATGGGRDKWKRPEYGKIAERYCDEIILTNEDPYDENPTQILFQIKSGISNFQFPISNFWEIIDRREAIKKAISLAKERDIVIITGKGSETTMMIANGKKINFDDRQVAKEILKNL